LQTFEKGFFGDTKFHKVFVNGLSAAISLFSRLLTSPIHRFLDFSEISSDLSFRRSMRAAYPFCMPLISPALPFSFEGNAEDAQRLKRLLDQALQLLSLAPFQQPTLLNLACGRADETGVLLETFAWPGSGGTYLGIDLRPREIAEATRRWGRSWQPQGRVEFRVADASLAHHWPEEQFDVIFLRHQNFWDAPLVWDQIFRHAMERLKPTGVFVFTSYFDREHELALAAMKSLGAELSLSMRHASSRSLADAPGKSVDRWLAIFQHPKS
jgi:2-polyprenyl-3-methyl-5-hydroxy-6-metoxy-1,4-benzoquinol methylase